MSTLQDGLEEPYVLFWPPTGVEGENMSKAFVVMKRQGGFLLALPIGFIPMADLQAASFTDEEAMLGPHVVIQVLAVRQEEHGVTSLAEELDVQLLDVSDQVLPGLVKYADAGVQDEFMVHFSADPGMLPDLAMLLQQAMEWVTNLGAQRAVYYSAEEGDPPVPKEPTAKPKAERPKRVTQAKQVAEHISVMAEFAAHHGSSVGIPSAGPSSIANGGQGGWHRLLLLDQVSYLWL